MRLSRYFLPVIKDSPADAHISSHKLMLRAGLIRQDGAGIYSWLPFGFRVLQKIGDIVRKEMDRAGAIEMLMPTLQQAELWRESGRYDDYGAEMLRIRDRHGRDMLYGPTNEELITDIFRSHVKSYRQLPLNLYHQQWKFRDEIRPRFGIMRGREFLMKDAYSFDLDEVGARVTYQKMFVAYLNTFHQLGVRAIPVKADPGPIGGDLSHEFLILADSGESAVYCDRAALDLPVPGSDFDFDDECALAAEMEKRTRYYAATDDMHNPQSFAAIPPARQMQARGIEVGHIFCFGTKYSKPMQAKVQNANGDFVAVHGGSYGIGISRLVGAVIEAHHDQNGIVWPPAVAPFDAGIISTHAHDETVTALAETIYSQLHRAGRQVLYDETDDRPGVKFARMDLLGLPWQVIIGPRTAKNGCVTVKNRADGTQQDVTPEVVATHIFGNQDPGHPA